MRREGLSCPELVGEPGCWGWQDRREDNRDLRAWCRECVPPIREPDVGDTSVPHPVLLKLYSVP